VAAWGARAGRQGQAVQKHLDGAGDDGQDTAVAGRRGQCTS
jgi:hypothetical protein